MSKAVVLWLMSRAANSFLRYGSHSSVAVFVVCTW